jgi:hypothetical protein
MLLDMNLSKKENTNQTIQQVSETSNEKINGLLLSDSSHSSPVNEDDLVTFQPGAGKIEIKDNLICFKKTPLVSFDFLF